MLEELKKLQELQKIDSMVFKKEDELERLPLENDVLKGKASELNKRVNELHNSISIQEEEKRKRTEILNKGEDKLKGITGKQSAIRNKEEYNTLLREIDNIKRFNKELEEEITQINREIDMKMNELQLIEEESQAKTQEFSIKIDDNVRKMNELEGEIEKMYEQRDKIIENIKIVVLRKYERILASSPNGKAIALAEDYICKGCNMTLPPQLYNNVLKAEKIEMCPNCQCILVPPAEIKKSASALIVIKDHSLDENETEIDDDDDDEKEYLEEAEDLDLNDDDNLEEEDVEPDFSYEDDEK